MRSKCCRVYGVILLVAAALASWLVLTDQRRHDLRLQTISTLNKIYVGILGFETLRKQPILELINHTGEIRRVSINVRLAAFFEENGYFLAPKAKPSTSPYILDAYGNPLVCLSREDAVRRRLPTPLVGRNRSIIIYSLGPNGKDDGGYGDDVYWEEP
ncbi:MAG: hypothetical protein C5B50_02825 [Verrucomicrobia bacterium]|nr:MAG: hypothetical protein C5B50_02825 [Verrucomicrobiota bacterium]